MNPACGLDTAKGLAHIAVKECNPNASRNRSLLTMTKVPELNSQQPAPAATAEEKLVQCLQRQQPVAIAVSGGVDSLTLAALASRVLPVGACFIFHAVSPAVPAEATERVCALAKQEGWRLTIFDAGEFGNENYRSNPFNRCFHCKHSFTKAFAG